MKLVSNQIDCNQRWVTLTATVSDTLDNDIGGTCSGATEYIFPYSESFENGIGSWSQASNDDVDWRTNSGPTSSAYTGPSGAAAGSNYYYIEASSNFSKSAILNSPCFYLSESRSADFKFKYHMYGTRIGSLKN